MTDQLIAPVIPSAGRPAGGIPVRRGGGGGLPLASLPADAVCGMSRVDASGRVITHVLKCSSVTG